MAKLSVAEKSMFIYGDLSKYRERILSSLVSYVSRYLYTTLYKHIAY